MKRQLRFNAFDMNCISHMQHGMWTHPRDRSTEYNTFGYWQDLARIAERGKFDAIFLADALGVCEMFKGSAAPALVNAVQIPVNDPLPLVAVMAAATKNLGFGVTLNLTYEPPFLLARRLSTLDHLTNGRLAWNVVTGILDSAARAMGFDAQGEHDDRYDTAEEYMEVVYKLWEGSWEDDAVVRDSARGIYARPDRVHRVVHAGKNYRMDAIHLCEPSPQRTPVLYQAGSSDRGRAFAARHAECVFINATNKQLARFITDDIRNKAKALGRDPEGFSFFMSRAVVVGRTAREAQEKLADYRRHTNVEAALTHLSSLVGKDLGRYALDDVILYEKNNASNSTLEAITTRSAEPWTLQRVIDEMVLGSRLAPLVGSAEQIADELEDWMLTGGVDGLNLSRIVSHESLSDFVDLVVPILQERGLYKHDYAPGTLREKLFGTSARLPGNHPAAAHRHGARAVEDVVPKT